MDEFGNHKFWSLEKMWLPVNYLNNTTSKVKGYLVVQSE